MHVNSFKILESGLDPQCDMYLFMIDRDKVAFITGGGSGIGFRTAEVLMR